MPQHELTRFSLYENAISHFLLGSFLSFLILFCLTVLVSVLIVPYLFAFVLLYTGLFPFLLLVRHAYTYFVVLAVPYLGSWLMSVLLSVSFHFSALQTSIFASVISAILVTSAHVLSRDRYRVGPVPMSSLTRSWFAFTSAIFLVVSYSILNTQQSVVNDLNMLVFYGLLLSAYTGASMLYVNSFYRYRLMCRLLETNRMEHKTSELWKKVEKNFPDGKRAVDLLRFYFLESVNSFEEGDYEGAFMSSCKVINEPTVVNPKDYVTDKREGEPSSFSEIRTILLHSRRKKTEIDVRKVKETRRKLPLYCLEILERCFAFLERLTADSVCKA